MKYCCEECGEYLQEDEVEWPEGATAYGHPCPPIPGMQAKFPNLCGPVYEVSAESWRPTE